MFEVFTQTCGTNPHFPNASLLETGLRCFSTILKHNVRVCSGQQIIAEAQNISLARVEDQTDILHSSHKQDVTHKELALEGKRVKMNGY
jgi:hypothetical protein